MAPSPGYQIAQSCSPVSASATGDFPGGGAWRFAGYQVTQRCNPGTRSRFNRVLNRVNNRLIAGTAAHIAF